MKRACGVNERLRIAINEIIVILGVNGSCSYASFNWLLAIPLQVTYFVALKAPTDIISTLPVRHLTWIFYPAIFRTVSTFVAVVTVDSLGN